jgi:hypothetical protein
MFYRVSQPKPLYGMPSCGALKQWVGFLRYKEVKCDMVCLWSLKRRKSNMNKIRVVWDMMPCRLACVTDTEQLVAFIVWVGQEEFRVFLD